jgi:hypothetical protein
MKNLSNFKVRDQNHVDLPAYWNVRLTSSAFSGVASGFLQSVRRVDFRLGGTIWIACGVRAQM